MSKKTDPLRNVGHGPCPCAWCQLMRRNPDATPSQKLAALESDRAKALR